CNDPKVLGLDAAFCEIKALGQQAPLQQFTDGRRPAWHALLEAPVIDDLKLFVREHNLEALAPLKFTHGPTAFSLGRCSNNALDGKSVSWGKYIDSGFGVRLLLRGLGGLIWKVTLAVLIREPPIVVMGC